jgi:hypothetical protein
MTDRPFENGETEHLKAGRQSLKCVGEVPDRPGYVICEYWGPAPEDSYRQPFIRQEIPANELRRPPRSLIRVRTR